MWEQIELSRNVKVARRPPGEPELEALAHQGIRSIVDLRTDAETYTDALSPAAEAVKARAHGIDHIRVPVSTRRVDAQDLDRVGAALAQAPKPVLVHCASGKRAGMTAVVHSAIETGVPGEEMLEMARNLDLVFGDPAQQHVFARYVDEREVRPDPMARREDVLRAEGHPVPLLPEDTGTLASELQEEHRRHQPTATRMAERSPVVRAAPATISAAGPVRSRLSRVKVFGEPWITAVTPTWPPSPGNLGIAAAVAGTILLVVERRVVVPVVIATGIVAGWIADNLRAGPTAPPLTTGRDIDREVADLEKRMHELAESA